jgi:predicted transcriptional regulator
MIWSRPEWFGPGKPKVTDAQIAVALAEEPSQAAAARRLGISPPAVCQRLRRARERAESAQGGARTDGI